jgi:hypothetical protein
MNTNSKYNPKRYIRRRNGTRQRNHTKLRIKQESQETTIIIINNVIYAPDCPLGLISPQQLHRQSKAKGYGQSCMKTDENASTLFNGVDKYTCEYHSKTKIPTVSCVSHLTNKTLQTTS